MVLRACSARIASASLLMPGMVTWLPMRYTASMPSVNNTRFRSSGTAKIFLTLSCSIRLTCLRPARLPQDLCRAARRGNLLGRLAAELVRPHGQRLADVAARQHLDAHVALDEAALLEQLGRHFDARLEAVG